VVVQETAYFDALEYEEPSTDNFVDECVMCHMLELYEHEVNNKGLPYEVAGPKVERKEPNYEALHPMFGWLPTDTIKWTFAVTTQFVHIPMSTILKKHYKSPFPALNDVHHREEPVATDTVYLDMLAIDDGSTSAQIFVGTESLLTDCYGG